MVRRRITHVSAGSLVGILTLLPLPTSAGRPVVTEAAVTAEAPGALLERAYDLAYNLDHDLAIDTLQRALEQDPDSLAAHRGMAALAWLRMLFLGGQVLVDSQMTATFRRSGGKLEHPPELEEMFQTYITKAVELSEEAVKRSPDDPEAHYQLGASLAIVASHKAHGRGRGAQRTAGGRQARVQCAPAGPGARRDP